MSQRRWKKVIKKNFKFIWIFLS